MMGGFLKDEKSFYSLLTESKKHFNYIALQNKKIEVWNIIS